MPISSSDSYSEENAEQDNGVGQAHLNDASQRALQNDPVDRGDPGTRASASAVASNPRGVPTEAPTNIAGMLTVGPTLSPAVAAGFSLRTNAPYTSGRREDVGTVGVTYSVRSLGSAGGTELDRAASIAGQGLAIRYHANRLYDDVQAATRQFRAPDGTMSEIQGLIRRWQGTPEQMAEALDLAGRLERELVDAQNLVERGHRVLGDSRRIFDDLAAGGLDARFAAVAAIYSEGAISVRTPAVQIGDHSLQASATARVIIPRRPEQLGPRALESIEALFPIRSTMVAVRAYASVAVRGVEELRNALTSVSRTLGELGENLEQSRALVHEVRNNPFAAAENAHSLAMQAEAYAATLQARGDALQDQARQAIDAMDIRVESGVEVSQATGSPGVDLGDVQAEWRWRPSDSFDLAVSAYLQHVVGSLPGARDRLAFDPASMELQPTESSSSDVYRDFFPLIGGVNVIANIRANPNFRSTLVGGVATDGNAIEAHLGILQQLGRRFAIQVSGALQNVVNMRRVATAIVGFLLGIGPSRDPMSVQLSARAGAAIGFGDSADADLAGGTMSAGLAFVR